MPSSRPSLKRRASEEYVERASRRGLHPLITAVAFSMAALTVMTIPLWWDSGRRPVGIVMAEVEGLRLEAAKHEDAARFDAAAAAVDRALETLERERLGETLAGLAAEMRSHRKQLLGKRDAAARLASAWAECKAQVDGAVEVGDITPLLGRLQALADAANGSPLPWVQEAEATRIALQERLAEARRRDAKRDWAVFRLEVTTEFDLEGQAARFGPAVKKIRAEFLPSAAPAPRKAAEEEIARIESRARGELGRIAKRAEKKPGPVGYLLGEKPRFEGCPVEAELDALIRSYGP